MEHNNPLISVIVPVYNVEKYVGRCLASIINQSYTNLEIIVVNDGSTDNSLSICEEFAAQDSRINLITQDNKGLSGARNTGLRHYTGEYVTFVDSDDWIHRHMIEYLYNVLIRHDGEMSLCGSLRVSEDIIQDKQYKELEETIYSPEAFMELFLSERFTACWSRLFRKDIISGVEFPEGLNCEDYIYMYEAIRRIQKGVIFVDIPLYYYYYNRPDSIVNDSFGIKKFDQYYSAKKLFDLVCEYTPQYKKQSLTRLAGAIVSLVNSARQHKGFEEREKEMISTLRRNAFVFLLNKYIKWKMRVLLFVLILPRKVSLICMRCVKSLAYKS